MQEVGPSPHVSIQLFSRAHQMALVATTSGWEITAAASNPNTLYSRTLTPECGLGIFYNWGSSIFPPSSHGYYQKQASRNSVSSVTHKVPLRPLLLLRRSNARNLGKK